MKVAKVSRVTQDGTALPSIIPVIEFISASTRLDGTSWLRYFEAGVPRSVVVNEPLTELAEKFGLSEIK